MLEAQTRPLFSFSLAPFIRDYAGLFFFFSLVAAYYWLQVPGGIAGAIVAILIASVMLAGVLRNWHQPVRKAEFFDTYFQTSGKDVQGTFMYSDIEKISKRQVLPAWTSRMQVRINVKGKVAPLVIAANPRGKRVKTDLYSWLLQKVPGPNNDASFVKQTVIFLETLSGSVGVWRVSSSTKF